MRVTHLLLVPDGVAPADVQALVRSRFPVREADDGGAHLHLEVLPGCVVRGPMAADLPGWAAAAYGLAAPQERGGPVPPELLGRGGLLDAFADGEPTGHERDLLELGLAMARRLGGAVRTESGRLLTPEPRADLLLYSEVWLHPDALVHVLAPHLPGIGLQEPAPVSTPLPPDARTGESLLTDEGERRWLHAEADAYDDAALAGPDLTESYGVLATDADGTTWSVTVEAAIGVPPVLEGTLPAGTILYELRCYPASGTYPADAVERIDAAGRALLGATGGGVVDDDGFLVDLG